jgi:hypothetical protein
MNRGRVGEERGGKEMDRCPLTVIANTTDKIVEGFGIDADSFSELRRSVDVMVIE